MASYRAETMAKSWVGTSPFTFVHQVSWDTGDGVSNIENTGSAESVAWGYEWEGVEDSFESASGTTGESYVQGHLKWHGGIDFDCPLPYMDECTPKLHVYPANTTEVKANGLAEKIQEDPDDDIY